MNGKIFIYDTSLKPTKTVYLNTINEAVNYFENICFRLFNKTRKIYMQELTELGYSADDSNNVQFIRSMQEHIKAGIMKNNKPIVSDLSMGVFNKSEYGD